MDIEIKIEPSLVESSPDVKPDTSKPCCSPNPKAEPYDVENIKIEPNLTIQVKIELPKVEDLKPKTEAVFIKQEVDDYDEYPPTDRKPDPNLNLDVKHEEVDIKEETSTVDSSTDKDLFICHLCVYEASSKRGLNNHMRRHPGAGSHLGRIVQVKEEATSDSKGLKEKRLYECSDFDCTYKTFNKWKFTVHLRIHTGEKPFACSLCDYRGARKDLLKDHLKIHSEDKPFSCSLCDYKAKKNCHLVVHLRTHTGEKPYSCPSCDYKCTINKSLKDHMLTHSQKRPYVCTICNYRASRKSYMIHHLRIHSGEKPFRCAWCDYQCRTKTHLIRHLRMHRRKQVEEVEGVEPGRG